MAGLIISSALTPGTYVFADEFTDYEKSVIEDDLKDVDASLYPANEYGTHRLLDGIGFAEYAYSTNAFVNQYYGVYLYVYNPTERELVNRADACVVNMALEYSTETGEPSSYGNVQLRLLDETSNHRFLKFGLADQDAAYTRARAYADRHNGTRRYDISGIQLWFKGDENATDANTDRDNTSYTYLCTGYAKGCSDESREESTLNIERQELKTLSLDVHHTYYRPEGTNGKGIFTHDSLNSIYFSVPNEIIAKYGVMSGIKGQYLRARTSDIFVTGNRSYFEKLQPYVGADVGYQKDGVNDGNNLMITAIAGTSHGVGTATNWTYNTSEYFANMIRDGGRYISRLNYVIYAESGDADTYDVSTEQLAEYMRNYTKTHSTAGGLVGGKFHPDLFSEVDDAVTVFDITAEDRTAGFQTVTISQKWWQKWSSVGIITQKPSTYYEGKEAIHRVTDEDIIYNVGTAEINKKATSDGLYIAPTDVEEFAEYYEAHKADNYVYKIAFAVDDYVSGEARQGTWGGVSPDKSGDYYKIGEDQDTNAWLALEYVYLNFEIIETRFALDGKETVIPVVMSPIDIIPDATHPSVTRKDKDFRLVIWLSAIAAGVLLVGIGALVINKYAKKR